MDVNVTFVLSFVATDLMQWKVPSLFSDGCKLRAKSWEMVRSRIGIKTESFCRLDVLESVELCCE